MAEQRKLGRRNRAGRTVVVEPGEFDEQPLQEKLRGQGGDHQVEALDPRTGQAEQQAHPCADNPAAQQRHRQAQLGQAQQKAVGGKCANRHEAGGAHRGLPGVAGQQVQAQPGQGQHQKRNQDRIEPIVIAPQRHHAKSQGQQAEQAPGQASLHQQ